MVGNKEKIINRVFKVLCIYEQNPDNYVDYLDTLIVEMVGYSEDSNFNEAQRQQYYETSIALRGLRKLNEISTIHHKVIRRTILHHVNKLSNIL